MKPPLPPALVGETEDGRHRVLMDVDRLAGSPSARAEDYPAEGEGGGEE